MGPQALAAQADTLQVRDTTGTAISPFRLDSLVVEILRSPVSANEAPYSIAVFGEKELLAGKALSSIEELLQGLPGIEVQDRFNASLGDRISIRGFGSQSAFGVRGIKVLVDGIPATMADGQATLDHLDFGSLGRVEILRGPSSTLYGTAAGGVIHFRSRAPFDLGFEEEARAVFGSHGYWRLHSTSSGTSGNTGYLVGVGATGWDGFRTNLSDPDGGAFGASTRLQLNSRVQHEFSDESRLGVTFTLARLDAENPGSLSDSILAIGDRRAWPFNVAQNASKDVTQGQLGLRWTKPLGAREIELSSYGVVRRLDNPIPTAVIDLDRIAGGFRGSLRGNRAVGSRPLSWMVGTSLDLLRDDRRNFGNDGGEPQDLQVDQLESVVTYGVFATTMIDLSDAVVGYAGLRYDRSRFEAEDQLPGTTSGASTRTMDAVSPSIGLRLEADRTFSIYGNVSTSFLTPTTTELANRPDGSRGFNPELDPTTAWSAEIGARGWLGNRLSYQVAAFRTFLDNELIAFEDPLQPGRTFFRNAGQSIYRGAEGMLDVRLSGSVSARITYNYLDAKFEKFIADGDDFSGNRIPGAAPHRLDLLLRAEHGNLFVEAHGEFADAITVNNTGLASAPSYWLADLRGGLTRGFGASRGLGLTPFFGITNILDEDYVSSVAVNAFGRRYFEPGPGRSFYVGLTAGWRVPGS